MLLNLYEIFALKKQNIIIRKDIWNNVNLLEYFFYNLIQNIYKYKK